MNGLAKLIDPTISLGTLIHLATLLIALIGIYWRMRELIFKLHGENSDRLKAIETKIQPIWDWWNYRQERRSR